MWVRGSGGGTMKPPTYQPTAHRTRVAGPVKNRMVAAHLPPRGRFAVSGVKTSGGGALDPAEASYI